VHLGGYRPSIPLLSVVAFIALLLATCLPPSYVGNMSMGYAGTLGQEQPNASQGAILRLSSPVRDSSIAKRSTLGSASQAEPAAQVHPLVVERLLEDLSLEEKIGQLFMAFGYGRDADKVSPFEAEANTELLGVTTLAEAINRWHLGGVIYLGSNTLDQNRAGHSTDNLSDPIQIARLSKALQTAAANDTEIGLLIAVDQEGGRVTRIGPPVTQFPAAAVFGVLANPDLTRAAATVTASELRALGITQVLAPVADVLGPFHNPAIGDRSFSSDPALAAALVAAQVTGLQTGGVAATAKHFPGHGDTTVDSHHSLPVITHNRQTWQRVDRPPFDAAINAQVDVIMTGHLDVPALDPTHTPATLSSAITSTLLRHDLGFDGVVMTDSLRMKAVRGRIDDGELAVLAFQAGHDILLMPPSLPQAITAVRQAVASGRITQQQLDTSVRRILRLKVQLGLIPAPHIDIPAAQDALGTPEHTAVREQISAACHC